MEINVQSKIIYHLSTCDTCKRILKSIDIKDFKLIDIKFNPISELVLDQLKQQHGSYETLFNKRARKYKSEGLKDQQLSDENYRSLILGEYTFLKRPIIIIGNQSFVGNAKKTIQEMKDYLLKIKSS